MIGMRIWLKTLALRELTRIYHPCLVLESCESCYGLRAEGLAEPDRLRLQALLGSGVRADVSPVPADPRAIDIPIQTIGTNRVSAEAKIYEGSPFSVDSDFRFLLESFRNTGSQYDCCQFLKI